MHRRLVCQPISRKVIVVRLKLFVFLNSFSTGLSSSYLCSLYTPFRNITCPSRTRQTNYSNYPLFKRFLQPHSWHPRSNYQPSTTFTSICRPPSGFATTLGLMFKFLSSIKDSSFNWNENLPTQAASKQAISDFEKLPPMQLCGPWRNVIKA